MLFKDGFHHIIQRNLALSLTLIHSLVSEIETLRLQVLECIRQRITVHYRLPSLFEKEVPSYILHHLRVAGLDKQIFTDEAMTMITSRRAYLGVLITSVVMPLLQR